MTEKAVFRLAGQVNINKRRRLGPLLLIFFQLQAFSYSKGIK